ncbi:MAG: hypothetical protein MJ240_06135 [Kiritimatiellae bacterium]|nr:hypothetical protein [Kiritimatiellia bacterium]
MKLLRTLFALVILGAVAVLAGRVGNGVETDLYGLADLTHGGVLREIAGSLAGRGRVLLEGPAEADLTSLAEQVTAALGQRPQGSFADTLRFLAAHKDGLLAPATREKLLAGQMAEVAGAALARLYGFAPPLFSVKDDPFQLATEYALSLQTRLAEGWTLKGGYPVCVRDGRAYWMVQIDGACGEQTLLAEFLARAQAFNAGGSDFGTTGGKVRIWCGGPPFHAACTAARAKWEINVLSLISLVVVLCLGWRLFGTCRFVPGLLLALMFAAVAAAGALFAFFPRPHVLSFVFGTSLIGLSVDYYYHARAAGGAWRVARPMTQSLVTTLAAFVPLFFAAAPVLRQMAVFTVGGLLAVWAWMLVSSGHVHVGRLGEEGVVAQRVASARSWMRVLAWSVVALTAFGLLRLSVVQNPAAFYRPNAYLAESEALFARLDPSSTGRFVYVRGATVQEALEREEAAGIRGLSALIPSLRRQRENVQLVASLMDAEGKAFSAKTGLPLPKPRRASALLDPERISDARLRGLVDLMRVAGGLISPCPPDFVSSDPAIVVLEPKRALENLFGVFTRETLRLLGLSLVVLAVLLVFLFRSRVLGLVAPVAATLVATAGTLGWLGIPITFFTLLCFFVLIGLAFDYAIFQSSEASSATHRAVRYSFLTSFVGLGALAFTDFAVTRSMGIAFALGLAYAYGFAWIGGRVTQRAAKTSTDAPWHQQGEQSAGRFRMAFMWGVYRFLGKGTMKALCVPVMAFIYPFARPARKALSEFYATLAAFRDRHPSSTACVRSLGLFRHLLGFAWAMADKTDACTLKKNLPRMTVRDDVGWRAFKALVDAHKGAFLISTHLGTIEVLPALPKTQGYEAPHVHAFQQMGHDAQFMKVFMRYFDASALTLHAVEDIGVETAVAMQEAIGRGELVLMAGDRVSAGSRKVLAHDFLGRPCRWPKGVFSFAKLMESPVFFVTCLQTGWNAYEVHLAEYRRPTSGRELESLLDAYVDFLQEETLKRPDQWYQFYNFFAS